jgi:hypothetical protein
MSWVETPTRGGVVGQLRSSDAASTDGAEVRLRRSGWFPFRRLRHVIADGSGYFGFTTVKPGKYQIRVKGRDIRSQVIIEAGKVTSTEVAF